MTLSERERLHNLFPDLDFDPEALREKYRAERDKRIREDGEDQYIEAAAEFADYADNDHEQGGKERHEDHHLECAGEYSLTFGRVDPLNRVRIHRDTERHEQNGAQPEALLFT